MALNVYVQLLSAFPAARTSILEPVTKNRHSSCVTKVKNVVVLRMWPQPIFSSCKFRRRQKKTTLLYSL